MTDIRDTKILRRLPEYLRQRVDAQEGSTEPLESLVPNSINVIAALLEKINEDLGDIKDFNNWADFNTYIEEFKLDDVFEEAAGFYQVSYPELLKGFFAFKGTDIDLKYLLKVIGFEFTIYDSESFSQASSLYSLIQNTPGPFASEYQQILDSFTQVEFDELVSTLSVWEADNQNPISITNEGLKIVNVDSNIEDVLLSEYGISLTPEAITYLEEVLLQEYYNAQILSSQYGDCEIFASLRIDMDSPAFQGYKGSDTQAKVRVVLKTRMSPCTYLKGTDVQLATKDIYSATTRVDDPITISLQNETVDEVHLPNDDFVVTQNIEIPDEISYLMPDGEVMTGIRNDGLYVLDNASPLKLKGSNDHLWLEETLKSSRPLPHPAIPKWVPTDDGSGNVDSASFPTPRRLLPFDVTSIPGGTLNSPEGPVSNGDIVKFGGDGQIESIFSVSDWTPIDDGLGNVDTASYPSVEEEFVRVAGLSTPLNSAVGILNNGDTVYFDYQSLLSSEILV